MHVAMHLWSSSVGKTWHGQALINWAAIRFVSLRLPSLKGILGSHTVCISNLDLTGEVFFWILHLKGMFFFFFLQHLLLSVRPPVLSSLFFSFEMVSSLCKPTCWGELLTDYNEECIICPILFLRLMFRVAKSYIHLPFINLLSIDYRLLLILLSQGSASNKICNQKFYWSF